MPTYAGQQGYSKVADYSPWEDQHQPGPRRLVSSSLEAKYGANHWAPRIAWKLGLGKGKKGGRRKRR